MNKFYTEANLISYLVVVGVPSTLTDLVVIAAPELWMPNFPVTHKCDVYSFGMLLFEIIGRRRNLDVELVESQEWFPVWVWKRFEAGEFEELIIACGKLG